MQISSEQVTEVGRINSRKCMEMILKARKDRNLTRDFINSLSSRYRGLIYFHASVPRTRHNLKFEELTDYERKQIIHSLRDLRALFKEIPASLSDSDSDI